MTDHGTTSQAELAAYQPGQFFDEVVASTKNPEIKKLAKRAKRAAGIDGRPTKLTPTMARDIIKMVMDGNRPRTACIANGITKRTLDLWKNRAKAILEAEDFDGDLDAVPETERIFIEFTVLLELAEAKSESALLKKAVRGGKGWQAAMTVLERRFADGWAKNEIKTNRYEGGERPIVIEVETDQERKGEVAKVLQEAGVLDGEGKEVIDHQQLEAGDEAGDGQAETHGDRNQGLARSPR